MKFAIITVSDSRTKANDKSGQLIKAKFLAAEAECLDYVIVKDDLVKIQATYLQAELTEPDLIILNGGTGIAKRDVTIPAITPLLTTQIPGFGEAFRQLSFTEVGTRGLASRALCGFNYRNQLTYCVPGSVNAVTLALEKLILPDYQHLLFERSEARKEMHHHVN